MLHILLPPYWKQWTKFFPWFAQTSSFVLWHSQFTVMVTINFLLFYCRDYYTYNCNYLIYFCRYLRYWTIYLFEMCDLEKSLCQRENQSIFWYVSKHCTFIDLYTNKYNLLWFSSIHLWYKISQFNYLSTDPFYNEEYILKSISLIIHSSENLFYWWTLHKFYQYNEVPLTHKPQNELFKDVVIFFL